MVDEPLIVVCVTLIRDAITPSHEYVALSVTLTGSPTFEVPFGNEMQTCTALGTEDVPPLRSSCDVTCDRMYSWSDPLEAGFLLTTAQRAPSFARCVSSIQ